MINGSDIDLDDDISVPQQAPAHLGISNVRAIFCFYLFICIAKKLSLPHHLPPTPPTNTHDPMGLQATGIFGEYVKMRDERDMWRTRYYKLK